MGILHKKQSAEYLRLAVRTEAVAAKLEIAVKTQKVTSSMSQVSFFHPPLPTLLTAY